MTDDATQTKLSGAAARALRLVCATLPHLAGLANQVRVVPDVRVETAGVFPSGRLLVNPAWFLKLGPREGAFVMAHELLHLALRTHQRAAGTDDEQFNAAHDFIINDILEQAFGIQPPGGGLRQLGARHRSAESLVAELGAGRAPGPFEDEAPSALGAALREALRQRAGAPDADTLRHQGSDVLPSDLERKWFPDQPATSLEIATRQVERAAAQAVSLEQVQARARAAAADVSRATAWVQPGGASGDTSAYVEALRTLYRPPWEIALHRWLDAVSSGARTYTRASRRGADRTDVVLPGRLREGWTLSIVLDTSGSMTDELGRALGVIGSFCEGAGVESVRVIQCDVEVTRDEVVTPAELERYTIDGFGGSDMSPALLHLAADPEVEAAIVISDGAIDYPETPMPYAVLWVLTEDADWFEPSYGQVIALTP